MAVKTITITTEAYDKLASLKGPKDSFSDVIIEHFRPKGRSSLWKLVGALPKERVDEIERTIMDNRRISAEETAKRGKEIARILDEMREHAS
jgi:predicted CopG family antitoxin